MPNPIVEIEKVQFFVQKQHNTVEKIENVCYNIYHKGEITMRIKKALKKIDKVLDYICDDIGIIHDGIALENDGSIFCMVDVEPREETDHRLLMTTGLSTFKNNFLPDKLCGIELYMRVPKDWKFTCDEDYEFGWPRRVFAEAAEIIYSGGAVVRGSTILFEHLINGSKHSAVAIGTNENDYFVIHTRKGYIVYLNVQTITNSEREQLIAGDDELLDKICNLPYVDPSRESLV